MNTQKALMVAIAVMVTGIVALLFWDTIGTWLILIALLSGTGYTLFRTGVLKKWFTPVKKIVGGRNGNHKGSYDDCVLRNRTARWMFLGASLAAFLFIPGLTALMLLNILPGFPSSLAVPVLLFGAFLGGYGFSRILPNYVIDVPQLQGFVTINKLKPLLNIPGSAYVIYGPGWHISFPWEERSEKSNFSLEVFTLEWKEEIPGKDSQLLVKGSYQFEVALDRSDRFIGIDEATIGTGGLDIIRAKVSTMLANETADTAKARIEEYNHHLLQFFGLSDDPQDASVSSFESRYGINSVAVTISGIDLPEAVQKTRDAVDEAGQVVRGIAAMYGMTPDVLKAKLVSGEITPESYNEMVDRFMANSGNAEMKIQALKLHGLGNLIPGIATLLKGK